MAASHQSVCGTSTPEMDGPRCALEALKILCTPNKDTPIIKEEKGEPLSKQANFKSKLVGNLVKFKDFLSTKPSLLHLYQQYEAEITDKFGLFETNRLDVQWDFVVSCLIVLNMTHHIIQESMQQYEKEEKQRHQLMSPREAAKVTVESSAPSMAPDTLSYEQQKTVSSSLQFIVCLGILPSLVPGVGLPAQFRSGFSDVVDEFNTSLVKTTIKDLRLIVCLKYLLNCISQPSLGGIILSRYLGDVLAALCQVVFEPKKKPTVDRSEKVIKEEQNIVEKGQTVVSNKPEVTAESLLEGSTSELGAQSKGEDFDRDDYRGYCCEQLSSLMSSVYQPMLVRELLVLQGAPDTRLMAAKVQGQRPLGLVRAPAWLRRACGRLLSDILIKPEGVQYILKGMLQGQEEETMGGGGLQSGASDWKKCDAVAHIIAHCPRGLSVDDYYKSVAPQVLELLHLKDKTLARHFLRVTLSTLVAMVTQHKEAAEKYAIQPLFLPLIYCLNDREIPVSQESRVLVDEDTLVSCIDVIHKVYVSGSDPQVASLLLPHLLQVLQTIFAIFCFSIRGVVNLRSRCLEILAACFDRAQHQVALELLQSLAFNEMATGGASGMRLLHPSAIVEPGGGGGAVISSKALLSGDVPLQPIEDLETRTACLVEVLKKVQKDNVTADFFLFLLDDLTKLIADRIEKDDPSNTRAENKSGLGAEINSLEKERRSDVLLQMERQQTEEEKLFNRNLTVLHLLASLAEDIGPACLQSPTHILSFVQKTLERGLQVLNATDDEMMSAFESETVTMAMGMLTALMGGAAELSTEDKDNMKVLLPLLEEFSERHPDQEVQEIAKDLRIAIATRGMVWSDLLRAAEAKERHAEDVKVNEDVSDNVKLGVDGDAKGGKGEHLTGNKGPSNRPLIEVISSQDFPSQTPDTPTSASSAKVDSIISESPCFKKPQASSNANRLLEGLKGKAQGSTGKKTDFQQAIDELFDPLIPVRGHGLISLRKLIQRKDPEALKQEELLCRVFRENLDHDDTYIYLSSVEGLAALTDRMHGTVVPTLVAEFANFDTQGKLRERKVKRTSELRIKIGEVLVKTSRSLGDVAPRYRDVMLGAMLTATRDKDPLVRASSMSNLGEVCKNLRFSLGNVIHEILSCVSALLKSDPDPEVRKAAALFTTLLLQGLGQDVTKVLETSLRDFYRLLRYVETVEKEEMVRVHILLALEELDTNMRSLLFPPQTLTKRIRVLDPE